MLVYGEGDSAFPKILMIRSYRGKSPTIAAGAYVDEAATVIGDVHLAENASVWPGAVLRGDVHSITIGKDTNIQDNAVLHGELDKFSVTLGDRVTVGHGAILHGCVIEDDCLIGIGAIVLNGARVGKASIVAAGALVPEGMQIPERSLVMGMPAKIARTVSDAEAARFAVNNRNYLTYKQNYQDDLTAND
jgi:gamma-carbonic anhydrase